MTNAESALPSRYVCRCTLHLNRTSTECACPSMTHQSGMLIFNCSLPYLRRRTTPTDNRAFIPTRIPAAPTAEIEESYQPTARHGQDAIRRENSTLPLTSPATSSQSSAVRNVTAPAAISGTEESYQPTAGHGQDAIRNITASSDDEEEIVRARRAVLQYLHRDAGVSNSTDTPPVEASCYEPDSCECSCSGHGQLEVVCLCETMVEWYCAIHNTVELDPTTTAAAPRMISCCFIFKFSIVLGQCMRAES